MRRRGIAPFLKRQTVGWYSVYNVNLYFPEDGGNLGRQSIDEVLDAK